jgi:membrane associated rhomboid family serine protease
MKDYLIKNRPKVTIYLVLILFLSNLIIQKFCQLTCYIALYPTNLTEPSNYYRLLIYPLFHGGLKLWLLESIGLILFGYMIENKLTRIDIISLILFSTLGGGVFYMLFNQNIENDTPLLGTALIIWGYWASAIVIGFKYHKYLNEFEKLIMIVCIIGILVFLGCVIGRIWHQAIIAVIIIIFTSIRTIYLTGHNK